MPTYIDDLDPLAPDGSTEKVSTLDDYVKEIKVALQTSFPALGLVAVTPSAVDLNEVLGAQAAGGLVMEDRISAASGVASLDGTSKVPVAELPDEAIAVNAFPSGTRMLFQQSAAPTGWTADSAQTNYAFRQVSPAGYTGIVTNTSFTSRFAAGRTTSIPSAVTHGVSGSGISAGSSTHTHSIDMDVSYVDCIIAERD